MDDRHGPRAGGGQETVDLPPPDQPTVVEAAQGAETRAAQAARGPIFPVPEWDKYQYLGFLGEGGMGQVFKVFDPRLKRPVAVKFLKADDAESLRRFLQEARVQSRVEHPFVCKIYEVGEVQNRPYIAMQFVAGKKLSDAAVAMTLEEKVKVLKEVAEAVHAAHRIGLIHRDIKPGKILVERSEEGGWTPYVMDFGLARDISAASTTTIGAVLGTPSYMAPEQARGEVEKLDRRTDVYGLGATLYELLAGCPPFVGSCGAQVLADLLEKDSLPPRKLDPSIPRDLETVALKCLEKAPQRRYESAKALAEDLGRFLDGDPVLARRAGPAYRLMKKARKYPVFTAVLCASAITVAVLLGLWLRSLWTASEKASLAQHFGQEAERMRSVLHEACLLPLHDTRVERELVRQRMAAAEAEMRSRGALADGSGNYALGSGYAALGQLEEAHRRLATSWEAGYRTPEAATSLGMVLGRLYQKGLEEAAGQPSKELRAIRTIELERAYRDPALRCLKLGGGGQAGAEEYLEGLVALYEKRYDKALEMAAASYTKAPWLYEALRLKADVLLAKGLDLDFKGDSAGALDLYLKACEGYEAVSAIARSDPESYEGSCEALCRVADLESLTSSKFPQVVLDRALAACDKALTADPGSSSALVKKSKAYWRLGEYKLRKGEDPGPELEKGEALARETVRVSPLSGRAWLNLGNACSMRALRESVFGSDPLPHVEEAIRCLKKARDLGGGGVDLYNDLGVAYRRKGAYEVQKGLDPLPSFGLAVESYQTMLSAHPDYGIAYMNLGVAYGAMADYELQHGLEASAHIDAAIHSLEKVISKSPDLAFAYMDLGNVYYSKGVSEALAGRSPLPSLDAAIEAHRTALSRNPDYARSQEWMGYAFEMKAEYEVTRSADPGLDLAAAREALANAKGMKPSEEDLSMARLDILEARWLMASGRSPEASLRRARDHIQAAIARAPQETSAQAALGEWHRWRGEWLVQRGESASGEAFQGLSAAELALSVEPDNAAAYATRGALYFLLARSQKGTAGERQAAVKAVRDLEKAFSKDATLRRQYGPILNEAKSLSGGG